MRLSSSSFRAALGGTAIPAWLAFASLVSPPAHATIVQSALLQYTPAATGITDEASDSVSSVFPGAPVPRDTGAVLGSPAAGYFAQAGIGVFGNLGVTANHFRPGQMLTEIHISDSGLFNPLTLPAHLEANFIVDGGLIQMVAAPGATVELNLSVTRTGFGGFNSNLIYESTGFTSGDLTVSGDDLGAFERTSGPFVEIPLGFFTVDLGIIDPGEQFEVEYLLTIQSDVPGAAEIVTWDFSDPFNLSGESGERPVYRFLPIGTATVSEPLPLSLAALGLAGVVGLRRRRSR